jgi:hypothetical protein
MSVVSYNSKKLIPAPFISLTKEYQRTSDSTRIGSIFRIVVYGKILVDKGSPNSSGVLWDQAGYPTDETISEDSRLGANLRKIEAIRELFSQDGYSFEVQSADGTQPLKCNPRVIDLNFPQDLWNSILDYTITLEADVVYMNGTAIGEDEFDEYVVDASEAWDISDDVPEGVGLPKTYRLTHTISATGKKFYDETGALVKDAWKQAQDYVLPRLGFDTVISLSSGVNNLPSYYGGYNHSRTSSQDELAGTYSVTETWILSSGTALEEFECSIKTEGGVGVTSVTINGTVTGLEQRDSNLQLTTSKYENASTKFTNVQSNILNRAQTYSGITLNPIPLSRMISKNDINGVITYNYDYDNRPTNIFSGVSLENISISETRPADLFAVIPVIGRADGPVLQDLSSTTERSVSLNIELAVQPNTFGSGSVSEIRSALYSNPRISQPTAFDNLIQAARPINYYGVDQEFVRSQSENWSAKDGRYSYSIEWVFGN